MPQHTGGEDDALLLLAGIDALVVPAASMPEPDVGPWALVLAAVWAAGVLARLVWMYARRYAVPPAERR